MIQMTLDFSLETMAGRKKWQNFSSTERKDLSIPNSISSENTVQWAKSKIKTFPDKVNLRIFITSR